jgi:hypothetical protein
MHACRLTLAALVTSCSLVTAASPAGVAQAATPPTVEEASAIDVAGTSATLQATIDPQGAETTYRFEYGTSTAYGSSAPTPDGIVGDGTAGLTVNAHVQGLEANTTYHYRVVALVAERGEAVTGSDGTFTTEPAGSEFALPDGRQWELVSPPNKHGAEINPLSREGATQVAEDGSAITYVTNVPTELNPQGYVVFSQDVSRRGSQGWSTRDIAPTHPSPTFNATAGPEYKLFSSDLSSGLLALEAQDGVNGENGAPLLSDEASENTPYVRHESLCEAPQSASECYLPVLTGKQGFADVPSGTKFGDVYGSSTIEFETATPDLRHVLLKSSVELTADPTTSARGGIYEWSAEAPPTEALQLISVLPKGETGKATSNPEEGAVAASLPFLQYAHSLEDTAGKNDISTDGSRVFWFNEEASFEGHLYMRDTAKKETLRLDVVQPGVPSPKPTEPEVSKPSFWAATPDGSKVLFADSQHLTPNSSASQFEEDLYECEIVEEAGKLKCNLTDLTPTTGGEPGGVIGVMGISENGSYIYFTANGVLGNGAEYGAKHGTCLSRVVETETAKCNLYVYHDGQIHFIATLAGSDEYDWYYRIGAMTSRVSPEGSYLAFMSSLPLTGYDNRDVVSGKPDMEVYLYDAATAHLACVSCNPTGSRPTGVEVKEFDTNTRPDIAGIGQYSQSAGYTGATWVAANLPHGSELGSYHIGLYQSSDLTDDGRMFFDTDDALVPQDVNGQEDVYEFEPANVGSCTADSATFYATNGGCVFLVSSGSSPEESGFLGASTSGSDVFFLTSAKLTARDEDTAYDVYDAHECSTSVPCPVEPVPSPPCDSGDSCKAAPTSQPTIFGAPASATFSGIGNLATTPVPAVSSRSLTKAQKLASALRSCRKKSKRKRRACEKQAKRRYAAKQSAAKTTRKARG